jgi:thiol-disulfide isomerase/thioredoxin
MRREWALPAVQAGKDGLVNSKKILIAVAGFVALAGGLYFVNRKWIAPLALQIPEAQAAGGHPFAPKFSLTDISGQNLTLDDYKGKVVLLDFWATWCGPCRIEIPEFVQLQKRYRDQGLAVIGISMDDSDEPVKAFYKEFNMNYPVAVGDEKLAELYGGILGLPTTMLIGRDGRIYAKHVGATDISVFEREVKELLAAQASAESVEFQATATPGTAAKIEIGDPAEINSEVPGVNLTKLTPEQKAAFIKLLKTKQCTCGCNLNLYRCRTEDRACGISIKLAREELEKFLKASSPTARLQTQ